MEATIDKLMLSLSAPETTWSNEISPHVLTGLFAGLRCFSNQNLKQMGGLVECLLKYMSLHRERAHEPLHSTVISNCFKSMAHLNYPLPALPRALLAKMKGADAITRNGWTGQTVSEALQGLGGINTTVPGVEDVLKEFASLIKDSSKQFYPHNVAYSIRYK
jgi:hypothetical protein